MARFREFLNNFLPPILCPFPLVSAGKERRRTAARGKTKSGILAAKNGRKDTALHQAMAGSITDAAGRRVRDIVDWEIQRRGNGLNAGKRSGHMPVQRICRLFTAYIFISSSCPCSFPYPPHMTIKKRNRAAARMISGSRPVLFARLYSFYHGHEPPVGRVVAAGGKRWKRKQRSEREGPSAALCTVFTLHFHRTDAGLPRLVHGWPLPAG